LPSFIHIGRRPSHLTDHPRPTHDRLGFRITLHRPR
jgi:hypothetical protein